MALHELKMRFETVGLGKTKISGTVGLKACVARTLSEINSEDCDAMPLPSVEREQRERLVHDERLLNLIREFNRGNKADRGNLCSTYHPGRSGIIERKKSSSDVESHPPFMVPLAFQNLQCAHA